LEALGYRIKWRGINPEVAEVEEIDVPKAEP